MGQLQVQETVAVEIEELQLMMQLLQLTLVGELQELQRLQELQELQGTTEWWQQSADLRVWRRSLEQELKQREELEHLQVEECVLLKVEKLGDTGRV